MDIEYSSITSCFTRLGPLVDLADKNGAHGCNNASVRAWSGELMSCEHESCEQ